MSSWGGSWLLGWTLQGVLAFSGELWGAEPDFSPTTPAQSNPLAGYKIKEVPWGKWAICGFPPGKKLQLVLDKGESTEGSSQKPLMWEFLQGHPQQPSPVGTGAGGKAKMGLDVLWLWELGGLHGVSSFCLWLLRGYLSFAP